MRLEDQDRTRWDRPLIAEGLRHVEAALRRAAVGPYQIQAAIAALHVAGFEIAIETNGTVAVPAGIDWVCVSPKAGAPLVVTAGDELKLVHPQPGLEPAAFEHLGFRHWFVQPLDGPDAAAATAACVDHCLTHPRWRISLQTHKLLRIP